jgi:hypothetical protein
VVHKSRLSAIRARLWRGLELFGNAKAPNDELVNLQSSDPGTTNGQSTNGYRTDGYCTDRKCA